MPLFQGATRPVATCSAGTCEACPVRHRLECHFGARQLLAFLLIAAPAFVLGGIGTATSAHWSLALWLTMVLGCFGLVEIRVMCSHCPHYAEPGISSLRCWANYGAPKLWRYRPGPMSRTERAVFFAGLALVCGYPLTLMLASGRWLLAAAFVLSIGGLAGFTTARMCRRCMNFACPLNRVDDALRAAFFDRNPTVAEAWRATPLAREGRGG
jgi:hypothetical protein